MLNLRVDFLLKVEAIELKNNELEDSVKFKLQHNKYNEWSLVLLMPEKKVSLFMVSIIDRINSSEFFLKKTDFIIEHFYYFEADDAHRFQNLMEVYLLWKNAFLNNKDVHHVG
jgi:hypothetical protein